MKRKMKEKIEFDLGFLCNCNDAVFFPFLGTWERDVKPLVIDRPDLGRFDIGYIFRTNDIFCKAFAFYYPNEEMSKKLGVEDTIEPQFVFIDFTLPEEAKKIKTMTPEKYAELPWDIDSIKLCKVTVERTDLEWIKNEKENDEFER